MALKFTKLKIIKKASEYPNREKVSLFFVMLAGSFFLFSLLILQLVSSAYKIVCHLDWYLFFVNQESFFKSSPSLSLVS